MASDIHAGHRERMRKRFLQEGGEGFADHELLEMLLYYAIPRGDLNPLAHRMIHEFGSLQTLIEAEPMAISKLCGVSQRLAILISLQKELSRRYVQSRWKEKPVLNSLVRAKGFCTDLMAYKNKEHFYAVCLDNRRRLIHAVKIAEGTVQEAAVHPRQIAEAAMKTQAASMILTHNHPGGSSRPTLEDIDLTSRLRQMLATLEVQLIDHIIVADHDTFSFLENKLLNDDNLEGEL